MKSDDTGSARGKFFDAHQRATIEAAMAMRDTAILEILNEVRGEEALADTAFAVDDEVDLFAHRMVD